MTNVVLLSVDALRFDRTTLANYDRDTTPRLETIASDATVFAAAYSGSSHTREAVPSLLTGRYPDEAVADDFSLSAPTLATLLADPYESGAFHSNPYVSRAYGFGEDFDYFYDSLRLGQNRILALLQRALDKFVLNRGEYHTRSAEINRRSLSWLDSLNGDKPFFLWNHYMDVHGPYNPPEQYNRFCNKSLSNTEAQQLYSKCVETPENVTGTERDLLSNLYDGEIAYVDDAIGTFVQELNTRGLLEDTLLIVTADHGDLFGEYEMYAHPRHVYPELLHVPLVVRPPGGTDGEQVFHPVSTLDVVPTILAATGQDGPELPGVNLLSSALYSREIVFGSAAGEGDDSHLRRYTGITQNVKHNVELDVRDEKWLSESNERRNAASPLSESIDGEEPTVEAVQERTRSFSGRVEEDSREADSGDVTDKQVEDRLEDLGYL